MQAFLSTYHGEEQSSPFIQSQVFHSMCRSGLVLMTSVIRSADLIAGDLVGLQTGVIWTAICVDYPGHSFEHLGIYFGRSQSPADHFYPGRRLSPG
jgi:hypothetical protein